MSFLWVAWSLCIFESMLRRRLVGGDVGFVVLRGVVVRVLTVKSIASLMFPYAFAMSCCVDFDRGRRWIDGFKEFVLTCCACVCSLVSSSLIDCCASVACLASMGDVVCSLIAAESMSLFLSCLSVGMRRRFGMNHGRSSFLEVASGWAPFWRMTGIEVNAVYWG